MGTPRCRCELGGDCTRTTLCEVTAAEEDAQERIEELEAENTRLREALEGGVMSDLPICACDSYYGQHHPECPVRKRIEELEAENTRLEAELGESQLRLAGAVALLPDEITCGQLREERDKVERLREALEAAPEPETENIMGSQHPTWPVYGDWWEDVRSKVLEGE